MKVQSTPRVFLSVFILIAAPIMAEVTAFSQQQPARDTFPEVLRQAQEKSQARDWRSAVLLWERVVELNPHVAWFWYPLATAQYNAGEFRKAVASFERSLELGAGRLGTIAFDIARSHAMLKEKEPAIKWLARALELGFRSRERIRTDEAFVFLRDDARFKAFTGEIDTARMSRTDGWRYDLSLVETEIKRMHFRPFRRVSQAEFESQFQRLRSDLPSLSDNQIIVRLMQVLKLIGDGHTGTFPDLMSTWKSVPLQFEQFDEGMFIIAADPKYSQLVGARVLRIGKHETVEVIKAVGSAISRDSEQGITRAARDFIRYPQVLNGLGLQSQADHVEISVLTTDGKGLTVEVPAVERDAEFSRIFGHPKWITAYNSVGSVPFHLKDRRAPYWFEPLPSDPKTLYFQFNLVGNTQTESFNAFVDRLFKFIDDIKIEKLIIDMRWNNGGNALLLPPLITGLVRRDKIDREGKLFVIVGRYTFSAATSAAALIEQNTNAIFVGEPTPSGPNYVGESNIITLPYSQVRVSISDNYWQHSWTGDTRTWIAPLLFVPHTFEAYKNKRDLEMETILAYPNMDSR